ncbi:unnamed protein product [Chironomus riparius]|uniref:Peptidase S1 domain-containing protein n=1 Tax=Chironomus riparius TaxID=315576 RepID=A0A9N9S2Y8_9DIPT|nr:unnamed protein product [Chironomus riparius]
MLRKTQSFVLIFLIVFALDFVVVLGQGSVNSGLEIGDECVFNETLKGFCQKPNKCDYGTKDPESIPEDFKNNLCLSGNRDQLVCCPSLLQPHNLKYNGIIFTKFEVITCKHKEPSIELISNIESNLYAEVGEFKFQAMIGYKLQRLSNEYEYVCGGALIHEDIVITSAYCLRNPRQPAVVKLGATSLIDNPLDTSKSEVIEIQRSVPHPHFSWHTQERANNIGLIKLKRSYNQHLTNISPICLSTNDVDIPFNFTITGYNISFGGDEYKSDWLLKATSNIHEPKNQFKDTQLIVKGYNGAENCFGDYGGPLIHEINFIKGTIGTLNYIYGIKSIGLKCGSSKPSIYTKVNFYLEWIRSTIESFDNNNNGQHLFS